MAKGDTGKRTGGTARDLIRRAMRKGFTQKEIGRATNRDPSTISDILNNDIKNPPKSLLPRLRKVASRKAKKKRR